MRQILGKMTLGPLVNPSKFGCDGKAINTIHCFTAILNQTQYSTNSNCVGSHVPPIREVFDFILSLEAEDHYANGNFGELNRTFPFKVLKAYFKKHFRHNTLPVITRPRRGKQLNTYLRDLQYRFRVKSTAPSNMYQGTIIKDILAGTEWLKQIENKLPPQPGLASMRRWRSTYRLLRQLPRPLAHQAHAYRLQGSMGIIVFSVGQPITMLPPDFKRRNPLRVRPFQDFDDAAPPPSNARNRLLNMVHETGGFNPTWRRKKVEECIAPKEDDEQKPSKRKRKNGRRRRQRTALERLQAGLHGTIVAYGMGIGKTLVAVGLYAVLKQDFAMHGRDWSLIDKTTLDEGHDLHEFDRKVSIQIGFLIVVQVDLIPLWEKELQLWYHSTAHTADELAVVDVVVTSYETLRSDYEDAMAAAASHEDFFKTPVLARCPTMVIYWRGQILDEAHKIANDKTGVNKAVNRV
ncbi:uncharacterized protein J4E84_001828 [Alternaria hordeiaustralica]|uniref:uncharacterized protein n=1 Tax=Alternaria hordeiaustralica TaxID=1187925 RepID=UPI0020C494D6|nr:uncharacterized protein J4E84_001828 [Alternaria hordeiaustralica]KAI4695203.1 hypothetical protein J4E84_001828 [Alternaria hordeiaustralica]